MCLFEVADETLDFFAGTLVSDTINKRQVKLYDLTRKIIFSQGKKKFLTENFSCPEQLQFPSISI